MLLSFLILSSYLLMLPTMSCKVFLLNSIALQILAFLSFLFASMTQALQSDTITLNPLSVFLIVAFLSQQENAFLTIFSVKSKINLIKI